MLEPDLSLQKPLEDYIDYIDSLSLRIIPLFTKTFAPSFCFSDPYANVKGAPEAAEVLNKRFKLYPYSRYKVIDFMWGRREGSAYIYYNFIYKPKKSSKSASSIEMMCEIKFLPDGKVFSHAEFWGAHDGFNIKKYKRLIVAK